MPPEELCFLPATEQARLLRARQLSCVEMMQAHLDQIARWNPVVNAIPTLLPERALAGARAADEALARGDNVGPLHGLPIAIKDTVPTAGIRTTYGSRIYADHVPDKDALVVERIRQAGAVVIGKTNAPEFGAGGQTFNEVFGTTLNPYDRSRTCGGSSGGAAVALAAGMLPLANGSDTGGSLRGPASFCNVVGFRPSPGRVPAVPARLGWWTLGVPGPMGRTVADTALLLSALAGPHPRSPIALSEPGSTFLEPLARDFRGVRIAWSPDLGMFPVERSVLDVLAQALPAFTELGCTVESAHPDFSGVTEAYKTLRAWFFELSHREHVEQHRDLVKDTVIWNTEEGMKLDGPTVARAEAHRTVLWQRMQAFLEDYEYLLLPAQPVPPFSAGQQVLNEVAGVKMASYVDWGGVRYAISMVGNPAVSVPAGFTADGLPVGLQIVGRHQADFAVLQLAHAFEQATGHWKRRPELAE